MLFVCNRACLAMSLQLKNFLHPRSILPQGNGRQEDNKTTRQGRGNHYCNSIIAIIKIYMVGFANGVLNILKYLENLLMPNH